MQTTLYIYLLIYVLLIFFISWLVSRKENQEDFLIAGRDRGWLAISVSKFAASVGVGYFIAYTGYAYEYGWSVFWIMLGLVIGYSLYAFWGAPRIQKFSRESKFYTQGDLVHKFTNSGFCRKLTNWLTNIVALSWLLTGIIGGAKVISFFGLVSYELALLITTVVVVGYILLAGFKAVLVTDALQAIIIVVLIIMVAFSVMSGTSFSEIVSAETAGIKLTDAIGFLLYGTLAVFALPNFYQLVYAAKDKYSAAKGIFTSIIPSILVGIILLFIGLFMFGQSATLDPDLVFIEALNQYLSPQMLSFGIVLFFAGLMSSADTNIYAITSHYVLSKKKEPKVAVKEIKIAAIVLGVLSVILGYFFRDVTDVVILSAAASVILSVPMIYLIAGGRNKYRYIGSVSGSLILFAIGLVIFGIEPTLLVPAFLGGVIGLIYKGQFLKAA